MGIHNRTEKSHWRNVSNFRRRLLPFPTSICSVILHCLVLVIFSHIVSSDKNGNMGSANSIDIPDQIAMAAEHRIGHPHGPGGPGPYGPPGLPGPGYGPPGPHPGPGGPIDEGWPLQSQHDTPQIKVLQVQCEKSHMRVNIEFDRPFYGMIFSKGYYSDPHCVHLAPGSGHLSATFDIYLDACGMTSSANPNGIYGPAPSGTFVENTIIIQYDPLVQEVWDQARKLRCTWYDFYEKSVTFRPFQVDMLHAVTANFLGDNLQCWMQIQVGKGPWASEVSGIVKIGQTMTMVLAIKDDENKFDMLVRNCVAHDGKRAPIQLVDQYGCVTRPKIMSRFHKIKNFGASASVVSYAYFQAFKFPDSMNVHFQCVIQVCRFQCPEPKCGGEDAYGPPGLPGGDPRIPHGAYSENKESVVIPAQNSNSIVQGQHELAEPEGKHQPPPGGPQLPPPQGLHQQHQQPPHPHMQHGPPPPQQHGPPPPQQHGPPPPQQHGPPPQQQHGPPPSQQHGLPPLPPGHPGHPHQRPILHPHPHSLPPPPPGFNHQMPMVMSGRPSQVMLPPMPPHNSGYSNVKREGVILEGDNDNENERENAEEQEDEEEGQEQEQQEPSYASLGGRPRSVDFEKSDREQQRISLKREERDASDDRHFVIHMTHVYKRSAQEMTDVETTRVIQVVAPGDVAFSLNGGSNNSLSDSIVVESTNRGEIDGVCMSVSSFVGGLVTLLLLLVVASLVAAFLFVRVRSIHRKTAVFTGGFDNSEFVKQVSS